MVSFAATNYYLRSMDAIINQIEEYSAEINSFSATDAAEVRRATLTIQLVARGERQKKQIIEETKTKHQNLLDTLNNYLKTK